MEIRSIDFSQNGLDGFYFNEQQENNFKIITKFYGIR